MFPAPSIPVDIVGDIEPINDGDLDCLAEVREVLKMYGEPVWFGVALLHKHFDVADGEILVERTDAKGRILTIKPEKAAEAGSTVATIGMRHDDEHKTMMGCRAYCGDNVHGNHGRFHEKT